MTFERRHYGKQVFSSGNCTHIKPKRAVFRTGKIERTVEGTVATFAMLEQSHPGSWDVLVIDGSNVFQAVDAV